MTTPTTQPDDRCDQIAREKYYQTGDTCPCCGIGTYLPSGVCDHCDIHRDSEYAAHRRSRILKHVKQQPKSEPSRECMEIANDLVWTAKGRDSAMVLSVAAALQSKQDEMEALREEVLGVIEPFAVVGEWFPTGCESEVLQRGYSAVSKKGFQLTVTHCRAALALRDKLKASQPTSPPPQTPHQ